MVEFKPVTGITGFDPRRSKLPEKLLSAFTIGSRTAIDLEVPDLLPVSFFSIKEPETVDLGVGDYHQIEQRSLEESLESLEERLAIHQIEHQSPKSSLDSYAILR
ncbi:uncharacterized protein A4U43_C01F18230 [Asparagus officinalis]|uniref:Uncharacterized protein n=1 Tax=Asparagus officinalis TaxID=4686 RepID=A0A5P1FS20_ASPOF|nr:uncharacterized protein A4U43_C01F18230 [Asparagus officinalis]